LKGGFHISVSLNFLFGIFMKLPVIQLSGSPSQIGHGHGESLREKIAETWGFYRDIVRADEEVIEGIAHRYAWYIENAFPSLFEEMRGISIGANMDFWKIAALNSRTEIIRTINSLPMHECTLVYSSGINILGQTWDWAEALESMVAVLHVTPESGPEIMTFTEPGILGKIGINGAGIGVGLTILKAPVMLQGLPIHVLLRACMECSSREEIFALLKRHTLGTTSSITVVFGDDKPLGVEILGSEVLEYTNYTGGDFCHTNHYISLPEPNAWEVGSDMESSVGRLSRARSLLKDMSPPSIENIKSIIQDPSGETPICHAYKPDSVIGSDGTVCRMILDPNTCSMEIGMGTDGAYYRYAL
jgi:isopenicillin-N N-acyltransferase-like protein